MIRPATPWPTLPTSLLSTLKCRRSLLTIFSPTLRKIQLVQHAGLLFRGRGQGYIPLDNPPPPPPDTVRQCMLMHMNMWCAPFNSCNLRNSPSPPLPLDTVGHYHIMHMCLCGFVPLCLAKVPPPPFPKRFLDRSLKVDCFVAFLFTQIMSTNKVCIYQSFVVI